MYRESWRQLQEETPQLAAYDQNLYSTWNISYEQIRQESPIAAALLRQWAYFSNEDLWYELLQEKGFQKPGWLAALTKDKVIFHGSLRILCSYGLVEAHSVTNLCGKEGRGYSVHGCVHSWMVYVLNAGFSSEMAWAAIECVAAHVQRGDDSEFWLMQRRLLPHADRCLRLMRDMEDWELNPNATVSLSNLGILYAEQNRFRQAESLFLKALKGWDKLYGRDHRSTIMTLNILGSLYANEGRHQEAEDMYEWALEGYEKTLRQENTLALDTFNNLANLYLKQGRFQEAKDMYELALEGYGKVLGQEHVSTLRTTCSLGVLFLYQGRFQEAEAMCEQALQSYQKTLGQEHTLTLQAFNDLGVIYASQGRLQEAHLMYGRALEGYEKALGVSSVSIYPSALTAYVNLGNLFDKQGELDKAVQYYQLALDGHEVVFGRDNERTRAASDRLDELKSMCGNESGASLYAPIQIELPKAKGRWRNMWPRLSSMFRAR